MLYGPEDIDGLLKWQHQELEKQFAARFAPLEQTQQQLQEHSVKVHAQELAKEEFTVAASWDRFEELRPKIYAEMKSDGRRTLESTYNRLYQELVKNERASLESTTRQKLLAEMKKAPVVPNTAVPGATKPTANARRSNSLDTAMDDAVSRAIAQHAS
jgi:RecA-family ATPase